MSGKQLLVFLYDLHFFVVDRCEPAFDVIFGSVKCFGLHPPMRGHRRDHDVGQDAAQHEIRLFGKDSNWSVVQNFEER